MPFIKIKAEIFGPYVLRATKVIKGVEDLSYMEKLIDLALFLSEKRNLKESKLCLRSSKSEFEPHCNLYTVSIDTKFWLFSRLKSL